jgi:hypothetical protein
MAGKKTETINYVGPSKEELAARQQQYDAQIAELQKQNSVIAQQYEAQRADSQRALDERTAILKQEAGVQQENYDKVLGTTKQALQASQETQAKQTSLMADTEARQVQASKLQSAQADKETIQLRDAANQNRRQVDQSMKSTSNRKKRRGLFSAYAPAAM